MSGDSTWAKAPEFADQPKLREQLSAETAADRREYLESGLRPVRCQLCDTCVLVKKNSPKHTSVQWTTDPSRCAEFAAQQDGGSTALLDTCASLQDSIDAAVRDGRLTVPGAD